MSNDELCAQGRDRPVARRGVYVGPGERLCAKASLLPYDSQLLPCRFDSEPLVYQQKVMKTPTAIDTADSGKIGRAPKSACNELVDGRKDGKQVS